MNYQAEEFNQDNDCSHVFHSIKDTLNAHYESLYLYCEVCDQIRLENYDRQDRELIEVIILKEGKNTN